MLTRWRVDGRPVVSQFEIKLRHYPAEGPGAFLGMTITDAAKKLLANRRKTLGNAEIVTAFKAGGLVMNSVDPINTVGSVLTRRSNQVVDIVKAERGRWGLAEWYPGRSFKKKGASKGEGEQPVTSGDPTAPEQPSAPKPNVPPE